MKKPQCMQIISNQCSFFYFIIFVHPIIYLFYSSLFPTARFTLISLTSPFPFLFLPLSLPLNSGKWVTSLILPSLPTSGFPSLPSSATDLLSAASEQAYTPPSSHLRHHHYCVRGIQVPKKEESHVRSIVSSALLSV